MSLKSKYLSGALVAAAVVGTPLAWWSVSHDTHASETVPATRTSQEGISHARDLSEAFNFVAETLRPSVVSISSVRHVRPRMTRGRGNPQLPPGIPEQFREFFRDDMFDRFQQSPSPEYDQFGLGSGVIVSADGFVLTNNHVVRDADEVNVVLFDERQLKAKIVGVDEKTDLAVLKIDATGLIPAKLGNSDDMKVGQWVLAIGSPFGLDQTVTAGIISAKGRVTGIIGNEGYEDFLQTDAAINPGNSGGPLVNMQGQVIGVNTAIASRGGTGNVGVGFAIPSNMAGNIMQSIIKTGRVVRGYLGASIQPLDEGLAESFNFTGRGVLIGSVMENSPAQKGGLREGDIVTELNGRSVQSPSQLRNSIAALAPKSKAKLVIFRDGRNQEIEVTVGELPGSGSLSPSDEETVAPAKSAELGLAVEPLTREIADQIGHKGPIEGVVVTQVSPGSLAEDSLIRPGDVIVAVGSTKIRTADDYRKALDQIDPKQGMRLQVVREGMKRFVFLRNE